MATMTTEFEPLLNLYYGEYYTPVHWEETTKATNYFAKISKGDKFIFNRNFLRTYTLDDQVVFKEADFKEGEIIEQKCVYKKGTKEETVFQGFFIIHYNNGDIVGEEISQKDALEYFDLKEKFPEEIESQRNKLRVKLGTVVRKLTYKYGEDMVVSLLAEILEDYFPNT